MKKIKVLVVDDSALVRKILSDGLNAHPEIEVVGTAPDPYIARDKIVRFKPDVLTLDVEMPRMDGLEFLSKLMPQYPLPVIMVSALTEKGKTTTLEALELGAVDFVTKPSVNVSRGLEQMLDELRQKVISASKANVSAYKSIKVVRRSQGARLALAKSTDKVIAIGASTGGTQAIRYILGSLPATLPGIVIVQHMPPGFTRMFSKRLDVTCEMEVKEAEDGDRIKMGKALIAPGGMHMQVVREGGVYRVKCFEGYPVNRHCPSVEILMNSVADAVGANAMGIMLTGMGGDGAKGMLKMKQAGSLNIAQDEETSVVFGMPKVAFEMGGVNELVPLSRIPDWIVNQTKEMEDG